MGKFFAGLLLIAAAGLIAYTQSPIPYYMTSKQQRLETTWSQDLEPMQREAKFAKVFSNLAKIEVHFTEPEVAEEFDSLRTPFQTTNSEGYILRVTVTRWIDPKNYGFVVQHEIFDNTDDKIYEFGRTYSIGLIL